jgi:thiol:disulfide interchange protein
MRLSSLSWIALVLSALVFAPAVRADEPAAPATAQEAGVAFEPGTPALADVLAKAAAEKKPAFLDFYTDT